MNKKIYHIGLIDNNKLPYGYGKTSNTVTVQIVSNSDFFVPYLWQYYGTSELTKKDIKRNKKELLREINTAFKKNFEKITIQ